MSADDRRRPERSDSGEPSTRDADAAADERQADLLVRLMGELALGRGTGEQPESGQFYEWLSDELRKRAGTAERTALEARAQSFAARLVERLELARLPVRCPREGPVVRSASVEGPLRSVLAPASAAHCAPAVDLAVAAGVGRELWDESPAFWIELPNDVPAADYVVLSVAGESMTPLLHPGDRILVRLGRDIAKESIVVARHAEENGYVVKRVSEITPRWIVLSSLNPLFAPIRIPNRDDCIIGTVTLRWCEHVR